MTYEQQIGQHLVDRQMLSMEQAGIVYNDLIQLQEKGEWGRPQWAIVLSDFLKTSVASPSVLVIAWEAVAKTYKQMNPSNLMDRIESLSREALVDLISLIQEIKDSTDNDYAEVIQTVNEILFPEETIGGFESV